MVEKIIFHLIWMSMVEKKKIHVKKIILILIFVLFWLSYRFLFFTSSPLEFYFILFC